MVLKWYETVCVCVCVCVCVWMELTWSVYYVCISTDCQFIPYYAIVCTHKHTHTCILILFEDNEPI